MASKPPQVFFMEALTEFLSADAEDDTFILYSLLRIFPDLTSRLGSMATHLGKNCWFPSWFRLQTPLSITPLSLQARFRRGRRISRTGGLLGRSLRALLISVACKSPEDNENEPVQRYKVINCKRTKVACSRERCQGNLGLSPRHLNARVTQIWLGKRITLSRARKTARPTKNCDCCTSTPSQSRMFAVPSILRMLTAPSRRTP